VSPSVKVRFGEGARGIHSYGVQLYLRSTGCDVAGLNTEVGRLKTEVGCGAQPPCAPSLKPLRPRKITKCFGLSRDRS